MTQEQLDRAEAYAEENCWSEVRPVLVAAYKAGHDEAQPEIEKLQAFKDFVHRRLDEMGISSHPDGEHSKAGCRIGDRLDIVAGLIAAGRASIEKANMKNLKQ